MSQSSRQILPRALSRPHEAPSLSISYCLGFGTTALKQSFRRLMRGLGSFLTDSGAMRFEDHLTSNSDLADAADKCGSHTAVNVLMARRQRGSGDGYSRMLPMK